MSAMARERSSPDTDSVPAPAWVYEPEPPDVDVTEAIQTAQPEETPTEPGYGHGV